MTSSDILKSALEQKMGCIETEPLMNWAWHATASGKTASLPAFLPTLRSTAVGGKVNEWRNIHVDDVVEPVEFFPFRKVFALGSTNNSCSIWSTPVSTSLVTCSWLIPDLWLILAIEANF